MPASGGFVFLVVVGFGAYGLYRLLGSIALRQKAKVRQF